MEIEIETPSGFYTIYVQHLPRINDSIVIKGFTYHVIEVKHYPVFDENELPETIIEVK